MVPSSHWRPGLWAVDGGLDSDSHPLLIPPASSKRRPGASLLIFEMLFFSLNPKGTLELAKQVSSLPLVNYNLLRYICK